MGKRSDGGERLTEVDLLIEVLSRLRVKPLLRCKAVSKSWYSLISSPSFVKSHLQRAITNRAVDDGGENNLILRLHRNENRLKYKKLDGSFSLFNLGSGQLSTNLKFPYPQGEYPVDPPSLLVGFLCGIACVCVDDSDYFDNIWQPTANIPSNIYLWNPTIKQSKLIPPHTLYKNNTKVTLGFGFDPIDFDFKVVRVVSSAISPEVYSANRDAWRNIDFNPTDVPYSSNFDVCLHGFLITTGKNGMMAFDLNKEVFVCDIKLPVINSNDARKYHNTPIVDFKDSIAVLISTYQGSDNKIILWTLDDKSCLRGGGVEASWTRMLRIGLDVPFFNFQGLFNNVDFILLSIRGWFLCNLDKNVGRYISTKNIDFIEKVFRYKESLLSFAGFKLVNWSANEDDNDESNVHSEDGNEESSVDSEDDEESSYDSVYDIDEINVDLQDGNEESSVDSEDDEESSYDSVYDIDESSVDLQDRNEESSVDSEDDEESSDDSQDDQEEITADSEDDNEESYEDDFEESSKDDDEECSGDSAGE